MSSGTSVEPQKAVYASCLDFCGTTDERYIYPVFVAGDRDNNISYSVYIAESDTNIPFAQDTGGVEINRRIYLNFEYSPQCSTERPPLDFVYGDGATASTTPTTTPTTTTPTFPNRFTEEDTRVTLGVVIGVLAVGAVLSAVAAWKQ